MKKNKAWKALGIVCSLGIVFVSGMAIGGNDSDWISTFLVVAVGIVIFSFGQYYAIDDNYSDEEFCQNVRSRWHLTRHEKRKMEEMDKWT